MADIRQDGLLATVDQGGTVLVRNIKGDVDEVLYSLTDMPVAEDYMRLLFN